MGRTEAPSPSFPQVRPARADLRLGMNASLVRHADTMVCTEVTEYMQPLPAATQARLFA